jgi:hypothetical protein
VRQLISSTTTLGESRVFRVGLGLFYPCLVGAVLSGAPSRRLGSGPRSLYRLVVNSATMFSYPPSPISLARDSKYLIHREWGPA